MQNTHNLLVGTLSIVIASLISSVLRYLTPMRLGLWQGSLRMQIFFLELHNKRWNMYSSFSRRRLWIKPGVFIRDITATVSWQYYKELVTSIVRMSRKYFWDIIIMKKKETTETSETPKTISLDLLFVLVLVVLVLSLVLFRWFHFVVSGFSWGQMRSKQMNKVHQIRLFRRYSGYISPRYFKLLCSMFTIRLAFYK